MDYYELKNGTRIKVGDKVAACPNGAPSREPVHVTSLAKDSGGVYGFFGVPMGSTIEVYFCDCPRCDVTLMSSTPTIPTMPAWPDYSVLVPEKPKGATCKGKGCPDPYNQYAEPNQADGSYLCYSCRNR